MVPLISNMFTFTHSTAFPVSSFYKSFFFFIIF
uniref:Uncharacterized protein n=1 Tax=Rhizophora mucronata TaxID=61149 RepID=A0A2P2QZQ0_RHIMU